MEKVDLKNSNLLDTWVDIDGPNGWAYISKSMIADEVTPLSENEIYPILAIYDNETIWSFNQNGISISKMDFYI